jgi:hypothetical protein
MLLSKVELDCLEGEFNYQRLSRMLAARKPEE